MSVTIVYQGAFLTFPDIDDPAEAYKRVGVSSTQGNTPTAPSYDSSSIKEGINRDTLAKNKDWLGASQTLYERTQGADWRGSDKELADWGLDRMARFHYNLPMMGVDAVSLQNAPEDQKKAFLFLLDNFDKVSYSWGGFTNFLKYAAIDPTNYAGLASLGIGTAAAQGAKFTTIQGVKSLLKTSAVGALEGSMLGGAQSRIEQEARVNAGGQESVDYGEVAKGAGFGAVAGGLLQGAVTGGLNHFRDRRIPKIEGERLPPVSEEVTPRLEMPQVPTTEMKQTELPLGNMNAGDEAAQVRMQRVMEEEAKKRGQFPEQDLFHITSEQENVQPRLPMDMPVDPMRTPPKTGEDIKPYDWPKEGSGYKEPEFVFGPEVPKGQPYSIDGQGRLFDFNEQYGPYGKEMEEIRKLREQADALERSEGAPRPQQPTITPDQVQVTDPRLTQLDRVPNYKGLKDVRRPDANDGNLKIPKWFDEINKVMDDLTRHFGVGEVKLWVADAKGLNGVAFEVGHVVLRANLSQKGAVNTLIHEFGHQVQYRLFNQADQAVKDAIQAAYQRDFASSGKRIIGEHGPISFGEHPTLQQKPLRKGYDDNFEEWFAEQVSRFVTTKAEPKTVVEQFFAKIAQMWQSLYDAFGGHVKLSKEVDAFLKEKWKPGEPKPLSKMTEEEKSALGQQFKDAEKGRLEQAQKLRQEADARQRIIDEDRLKITQTENEVAKEVGSPELRQTREMMDKAKPGPDEKIGGKNGPDFSDLMKMINDLANKTPDAFYKRWTTLAKASDPLRRALLGLTNDEAKGIIKQLMLAAHTDRERMILLDGVVQAQNNIHTYVESYMRELKATGISPERVAEVKNLVAEAEKIFSPLKELAKEAGTWSGRSLNEQRQNLYKASMREESVDALLQQKGVDPAKASPQDRADAFMELVDMVNGVVPHTLPEKDYRLRDLRRQIVDADVSKPDDVIKLYEELELMKKQIADENWTELTQSGRINQKFHEFAGKVGYYMAATVLTPASVNINTVSNAFRTFTRPFMEYIARGPLEYDAFRQMTATYGAFWRVKGQAFQLAKKAFELNASLINGTENKWLEHQVSQLSNAGNNQVVNFVDRNFIQIWLRLLGSTDEFFYQVSYHGFNEGNTVAKALKEAREQGMDAAAREAHVTQSLEGLNAKIYNTEIDSTVVGQLYTAGRAKGMQGDELRMWINNEINNNPELFRRATDEAGISHTNDLLFKNEFSGEGAASSLAKWYEKAVQDFPALRIMGQLFFRTPVRVFEAGIRMTPGLQMVPGTKFISDLRGENGALRQLRAQSEALFAYSFATSVITGYATGAITGDGGGLDYRERRNLENNKEGWQPYSIKIGDTWVSYRNMDPFSTPLKIIANAMDRMQRLEFQRAQGVLENKEEYKQIVKAVDVAISSVAMAIRDANLTSGINDGIKFIEALSDPDRNEAALLRFAQSKIELGVPNVIRRGQKMFGEGQNVLNEPQTMDQILTNTINPSSPQVTHQFDALGFKRNISTQGFANFLGLDITNPNERTRGLSKEDNYSLQEIAKMSYATGSRFIPPYKNKEFYDDKDLRSMPTADGMSTIYNRAMDEYNRNMPALAYQYLKSSEALPMGRSGGSDVKGPRVKGFEQLQHRVWLNALRNVQMSDARPDLQMQRLTNKQDVMSGRREVAFPFSR